MERIRILMSARKQRRNCRRARHTWRKRRGSVILAVGHGSLLRVTLGTGPRNATACWDLTRTVENRDSKHSFNESIRMIKPKLGIHTRQGDVRWWIMSVISKWIISVATNV